MYSTCLSVNTTFTNHFLGEISSIWCISSNIDWLVQINSDKKYIETIFYLISITTDEKAINNETFLEVGPVAVHLYKYKLNQKYKLEDENEPGIVWFITKFLKKFELVPDPKPAKKGKINRKPAKNVTGLRVWNRKPAKKGKKNPKPLKNVVGFRVRTRRLLKACENRQKNCQAFEFELVFFGVFWTRVFF